MIRFKEFMSEMISEKLITFKTLLISSVFLSTSAFADGLFIAEPMKDWSYTLSYNFFTIHHSSDDYKDITTNKRVDWNENNQIIGVRVNVNKNIGYYIGHGKNSYYEYSTMTGVEFSTSNTTWEIGSDLGIATGYEEAIKIGIIPIINPFIRYNLNLTNHLTTSVKVGSMNFMAENAFVELKFKF